MFLSLLTFSHTVIRQQSIIKQCFSGGIVQARTAGFTPQRQLRCHMTIAWFATQSCIDPTHGIVNPVEMLLLRTLPEKGLLAYSNMIHVSVFCLGNTRVSLAIMAFE
jgi:hypothetical protein